MQVQVYPDCQLMSHHAAQDGAALIRQTLAERGEANIVVATGASQLAMLEQLVAARDIDWTQVTGFHLDEYIGLSFTHPASFRNYLWTRFVSRLPVPLKAFHFLNTERPPEQECQRVGELIARHPIDVAFIGIGENGHVAFNDPPANFKTRDAFICVELDEACRRQQLGEGWFESLESVPKRAITMSIRQVMSSRRIVCTVPDERKAAAVSMAVEGAIVPEVPASILQTHPAATIYLDQAAASRLSNRQYEGIAQ